MNSVPFGREECFFRALIIKRRASGTGAANRCAKKLQGLRDARTMRERLHDLRRLGGRTAHTVRKPVAHARWDRVGFVGKARAIRVGNRGTPTWKTRWNRVGFAPDPRGIPARPTPQNVRWQSLQWKSGPAQTKQRTGGAFGEDRQPEICTFYGIRITINCEKNAPHHKAHFHASYGGFEAVYSTEGELLAGKLPPRQTKLVIAWAALHKPELDDNWYLASSNGTCFRIDPLI